MVQVLNKEAVAIKIALNVDRGGGGVGMQKAGELGVWF